MLFVMVQDFIVGSFVLIFDVGLGGSNLLLELFWLVMFVGWF